MAYTDIDDPSAYFGTTLYTGNETARAITFDGNSDLDVDWIWLKSRSASGNHHVYDTVRGTQKFLRTNLNYAEGTNGGTDGVTAFGSNGFTVGANTGSNQSGVTFVGWGWKAGTTSIPSGGSLAPTAVSINATSGFGIYKYTGNGAGVRTIAHGLGVIPKMIIVKKLDGAIDWAVYNASLPLSNHLELNNTDAATASNIWWTSRPTSSLIHFDGNNQVNGSGSTYVAYVFADVQGYSKFSSYTGNGNVDGTFVYTGFKPAFVMIKRTDSATNGYWSIFDTKRNTHNVNDLPLRADSSVAQSSIGNYAFDILSNGFKTRATNTINDSGATYIYMCFAENPFVTSTGVPATAR